MSTAFATFKVILGFITMEIFLGRPLFFFESSWLTTTHSVKSRVFGAMLYEAWKSNSTKGCKKSNKKQQMVSPPIALRRVLSSMPTPFHQGDRPCDRLPEKTTCIRAKERAIRPIKGAKSEVALRSAAARSCVVARPKGPRPKGGRCKGCLARLGVAHLDVVQENNLAVRAKA